jgi:TetR/AcrR family transcriptional repressor of nem operon
MVGRPSPDNADDAVTHRVLIKNQPVGYIPRMVRKSEQTKARIVATASRLFWKRSYHAVGVGLICDAAQVNKATLYQYFASKEVLALAVIEDNSRRTVDTVFEGAFAASDDPVQRLEGIYRRVFETTQGVVRAGGACPGCPFVNIGAEMSTQTPRIRAAVNKTFERFAAYYRRIVRDAAAQGRRRSKPNEDKAVRALIATMNGVMLASKIENRPEAILEGIATARLILGR